MKKINVFLIVFSVLLLSACGESKPDDLPVSVVASANKSASVIAAAGASYSIDIPFSLSDFAAVSKYAKWVKQGDLQTNSTVKITGIESGGNVELKNVRLTLKSNPKRFVDLGTVTANRDFMGMDLLDFLKVVATELGRKKSPVVVLTCTSTNAITSPVIITINMEVEFKF